jgi:lysophospholipase L1-like esterase
MSLFNNQNNNAKINQLTTQLAQNTSKWKLQRNLLANFYQKLMKKQNVTIVCQGDSLTYGQDAYSADKIAPSGTADNGEAHVQPHAATTYPMALQTYLRQVYVNTSTVINKGYSGDWVENSLIHWTANANADLAFIMLGTNDSDYGAGWVPSNVKGNLTKYMDNMRTLIEQYTNWNTAVVLLAPPKLRDQEDPTTTTGHDTEPFRLAMKLLAEEYGCGFVDAETFMNGCDYTYYSDGVHLNSKGYQYFSSRLMSVLIGYGEKNKVTLKAGDTLLVRTTRDNIVNNGGELSVSPYSLASEEGDNGQGLLLSIGAGSSVFYGFETEEDNLILIPIFDVSAQTAISTTILDFNNEQGSIPLMTEIDISAYQGTKPASSISSSIKSTDTSSFNGSIRITTPDRFLHIANKGWHNIKLTNTGDGTVYFNGFVVMSYKDFLTQSPIEDWNTAALENGWTGTVKYTKDSHGTVYVKFNVTAGTVAGNTSIATLNEGYRPSEWDLPILCRNATNGTQSLDLYISIYGGIAVSSSAAVTSGQELVGQFSFYTK